MCSPLSKPFDPFASETSFYASTLPSIIYSPPSMAVPSGDPRKARAHLTQTLTPKQSPKILNSQEIESRMQSRLTRSQPGTPPEVSATLSPALPPAPTSSSPLISVSTVRSLQFSADAFIPEFVPPSISNLSSPNPSNSSIDISASSSTLIPVHDDDADITVYYDPVMLRDLARAPSPFLLSPGLCASAPCDETLAGVPDLRLHSSMGAMLTPPSHGNNVLSVSSPEFIPLPVKPAQWVMQLPDKVHFSHRYTLWFDNPPFGAASAEAYASAQKPICTVCNIRAFWEWTNNLPEPFSLPPRAAYHWMRRDTVPLWEEEANVFGGNLSMHIRPEDTSYAWLRLVLGMMGGSLRLPAPDRVCGVSVSLRRSHTVIHIWNKAAEGLNVPKLIEDCLAIIPSVHFSTKPFYRSHKDLVKHNEARVQLAQSSDAVLMIPPSVALSASAGQLKSPSPRDLHQTQERHPSPSYHQPSLPRQRRYLQQPSPGGGFQKRGK